MLVNETFARLFLPGRQALGGRFTRPERASERGGTLHVPHEVVGLVADARYSDLREAPPATVYLPLLARPEVTDDGGTLEIRSSRSPADLEVAVRRAAARVTPAMKVTAVTEQSTLVIYTILRERLLALLSGFFALVSLALAALGSYGVLSYSVLQQTREIGIRMALGAARRTVVGMVVGGVAAYVGIGVALGLAAGLWLSRFVTQLLYEVQPRDSVALLVPVALLLTVAAAAALVPVRRAADVDPLVALRDE